jgi:hypothetical protein
VRPLPYITRKKLLPGQPGSAKYVARYGETLVAVRYRYNEEKKRRRITVELVVDERHWEKRPGRIPRNRTVRIRIPYNDNHLRQILLSVGGKWISEERVWELEYGYVRDFGLESRIVQ